MNSFRFISKINILSYNNIEYLLGVYSISEVRLKITREIRK